MTVTVIVNFQSCSLPVALMLFAAVLPVMTCQAMGLVVVEKKSRPLGDSLAELELLLAGRIS